MLPTLWQTLEQGKCLEQTTETLAAFAAQPEVEFFPSIIHVLLQMALNLQPMYTSAVQVCCCDDS